MNILLIVIANLLSFSYSYRNEHRAALREVAYQVSLVELKDNNEIEHTCSGAIIQPQWILTAGHCAAGIEASDISINKFAVIGGTLNLHSNENNDTKQIRGISKIYLHEYYDDKMIRVISAYDIALVNLTNPFVLNCNISVIALPEENEEFGNLALVSGWNLIKNRDLAIFKVLSYLRITTLNILDLQTCLNVVEEINLEDDNPIPKELIESNIICTGPLFSRYSVCVGDSGSPLVSKAVNGVKKIIGIVSYIRSFTDVLGEGPVIYTRVSSFLPWINDILRRPF